MNDRQRNLIASLRTKNRVSNTEYQELFGVAKRTAHRDLDYLVKQRILKRTGRTGKGTFYSLNKGATKVPKGSSSKLLEKSSGISKGAIKGPKGPSKKALGNGTFMGHMGHAKSLKTKGVIKGTLVKASSHKKKNRTSRHSAMKPSKSRKLKPTVRKAKKKSR
jgi:hypothetical protein